MSCGGSQAAARRGWRFCLRYWLGVRPTILRNIAEAWPRLFHPTWRIASPTGRSVSRKRRVIVSTRTVARSAIGVCP